MSMDDNQSPTEILRELGLIADHEKVVIRRSKKRVGVACQYPGGCPHQAYLPSVFCEMHQEELAAAVQALEKIAGAARDLIWYEESRKRRNKFQSRTTSRPWNNLRAALTVAEQTLIHEANKQ